MKYFENFLKKRDSMFDSYLNMIDNSVTFCEVDKLIMYDMNKSFKNRNLFTKIRDSNFCCLLSTFQLLSFLLSSSPFIS